jgi:hypothetical protein
VAANCSFQLRCALPASVHAAGRSWTLALSYQDKGRYAALVARAAGKEGEFLHGRTRDVEAALWRPITVPTGTIRHAIAEALAASGRADLIPDANADAYP